MKIVVVSDNHGDLDAIKKVLSKEYDGDLYLHLGDSEYDPKTIEPFIAVRGNNDSVEYPIIRIKEIMNHRILMIHGSYGLFYDNYNNLVYEAKNRNCDVVLFGHSHRFENIEIDGVKLINPGSLLYNRDYSEPSYAILNIDENGKIEVFRKELNR